MALYVFITPDCEKDIQEHQMEETVLSFKQRILQDQRTTLFDRYPPPYLKKRFKRQERLIAAEMSIPNSEDIVVIFLRMFVRSGREYESFKNDPRGYGDKFFVNVLNVDFLKDWLNKNREVEKIVEKDPPNEEESAFLWKILSQDSTFNTEEFVFESEDWQRSIFDKRLQDRLITLPDGILKCMQDNTGESCVNEIAPNIKVLFRNFKGFKKIFLAGIFLDKPDTEIEEAKEKYGFVLKNSQVNEDDIIKASRRSYPGLILLDVDIWIDVQKNKEANLALSPEESALLQSVYQMSGKDIEKTGFPLFINGRAGSGKSTILQYLFSDYLGFYINERISSTKSPIYLTYSKDLVEKSKTSVFNILSKNYKYSVSSSSGIFENEDISRITNDCFILFRELLIRIIRYAGIRDLFSDEKYIDYREFKNKWKVKFQGDPKALDNYGPDISWHVIRTYIKGYSTGGYIDEEEYEELPRDEKTVTRETFKVVYQKVWNNWYKFLCDNEEENCRYWDDQDIVRYIIEKELYKSEYPAIFCDEAQDFTRIELEFLFRSSIFSNRKITSQDLNRVPFVFAGDPFQTLNPTGFNWENIKAAFVQKFIYSLDPKMVYGNPQLHYEELSYNYRSAKNIVRLCNSLQALRALYFGHKNLEPQTTWLLESTTKRPVYFKTEDSDIWDRLKEYPDILIIVPCAEGEEPIFVQNDTFLSAVIQTDETGVPRNVISPMRSKGLEFERVVVYGFGAYCKKDTFFEDVVELCGGGNLSDKEKMLTYEYYLNQLYVAISRAQKLLIVVDTEAGINKFWKFAIDPEYLPSAFNAIGEDIGAWEDEIGVLNKGTNEVWSGVVEDRQIVANRLESEGKEKKDPFMLRQAAMVYKDMQNSRKEKHCRAMAYELETKYNEAGKLFSECDFAEDAVSNFWKSQNFTSLRELSKKFPSIGTDLRIRAANQERDSVISTSVIIFKDFLELLISGKESLELVGDKTWPLCIFRIIENLLSNEKPEPRRQWKDLSIIMESLYEEGFLKLSKTFGHVLIKADEYSKAVKVFEELGDTSSKEYHKAKSQVMEDKLASYMDKDLNELNDTDKKIAAKILFQKGKFIESAKLFHDLRDAKMISEITEVAFKSDKELYIEPLIKLLFSAYAAQGQFRQILSYFEESPKTLIKTNNYYPYIKKNIQSWIISVTKDFAGSKPLGEAESIEQIKVSEFLRINFLENKLPDWRLKIHPLVVGAAMERAGKDLDCLRFYGLFEDAKEGRGSFVGDAKKRLAAVKLKQAAREDVLRRTETAARHREEAEEKAKMIGISIKDIPMYPDIREYLSFNPLAETEHEALPIEKKSKPENDSKEIKQPASSYVLNFPGVDIRVSTTTKKVQLTQTTDLSSITLNLNKMQFSDTEITVVEEQDDLVIKEWNVIVIGFKKFNTNSFIVINFLDFKCEIKIDLK